MIISTHAPAWGATGTCGQHLRAWENFNSHTSTHAPREGCDRNAAFWRPESGYFNSRTPRGAQLDVLGADVGQTLFQLTYPMRGTTRSTRRFTAPPLFQLTYPVRDVTGPHVNQRRWPEISIPAPHEGCDCLPGAMPSKTFGISIPAPREGCGWQR